MTNETNNPIDDEFDVALRRVAEARLSQSARERHRVMLAALAAAEPELLPPERPLRRRRTVLIATVAAVLAAGVGVGSAAAAGAFRSAPPTDRRIAHCYTTASLTDPHNHEDFTVASDGTNPSLPDAASHAMDICTGGWLQGRYSSTDPKVLLDPKPAPWNYPLPHLIACVLPSGEVGVFPGTVTTCTELGLDVAQL
ncbi:MAG TPA: hypothetical protein VGL26_10050 [Jatrophihabitans sp.]|jgi:hypothetical protein